MKKNKLLFLILIVSSIAFGQQNKKNWIDTVSFSPIDNGKMWVFDNPPKEYFEKTYNFSPSDAWFEKARLSAIRLPSCSASLISEDGLLMTNHHCARGSVANVQKPGEVLAETGFYATNIADERKISNFYVDQLRIIEDVTSEIQDAFNRGKTDEEKIKLRNKKIDEVEKRYNEKTGLVCNVITFYNGGRYSLYGYKRFTDIRLVFAPETVMGFFGGDPDNFTFPRYDLDMSFMRIYENGKPYKTSDYFKWSKVGVKADDPIFVIGNPGRTNRYSTMSQLEFSRDVSYPYSLSLLTNMVNIYNGLIIKYPEKKHVFENALFGFANSQKVYAGILNGLLDEYLMAKKKDFERKLKSAVINKPELRSKYVNVWDEISKVQTEKAKLFGKVFAYNYKVTGKSSIFAFASELVDMAYKSRLPENIRPDDYKGTSFDSLKSKVSPITFNPEIEIQILAFQLEEIKTELSDIKEVKTLFAGKSVKELAEELVMKNPFTDIKEIRELFKDNCEKIFSSDNKLLAFLVNTYYKSNELKDTYKELQQKEAANIQLLGNAIYEVFGNSIPPDGTFTLRIADGIVKGFEYNGTIAPPITTFYGLYDRHYSFNATEPWKLPDRWLHPSKDFNLSTPLDFVSTADTYGGNSGSPAVNKNLEIVGLNFDRNIDGMSRDFIYTPEKGRNVMVHSDGILEALKDMYKTDRLVKEIQAGKILE
jgi:hypothetical protein